MEYRVRWCGYPEDCDDWILDSKTDCPEAIKEYWESMKKEVPGPPKKRSHDETCEDEGSSKSVFHRSRKAIHRQRLRPYRKGKSSKTKQRT
ncbi:unnamed protein product [Heligmosomoides polygyrus]|uniref:Chromo domain-containing protein n=1 Tax=Heligmosomoides polygyrus TaxID=6339 RepID=A0A183G606_HELPZ|nr:unnamed protein product [Heligmosomoides polygyrus]